MGGVSRYFGFINGVDNVNWPQSRLVLKVDI